MFFDFRVPIPTAKGKISRQKTKSATYVHYILERTYNAQKKYNVPKRVLIGRVCEDDPTKMYPNEEFFKYFKSVAMPEARPNAYRSSCIQAGTFMVIEKIVEEYNLKKLFKKHFGDRAGLLLDLISYMIVNEQNQGQHYPEYAYRHPLFTDGMRILSDSTISKVLGEISPNQITDFMDEWNKQKDHRKRIYISYDSTNKNSQAGDIDLVEFGKPKVDIGAPIINVSIAMDTNNKVPLFYELYPGSVNDVSQLKCFVDKAKAYHYNHIGFILDRGYFSKANIEYMDQNNFQFIMMIKGCKQLVSSIIDEHRQTLEFKREYHISGLQIQGKTIKRELYQGDKKQRYFHLFYSPAKAYEERKDLDLKIKNLTEMCRNCIGKKAPVTKPFTTYFSFIVDEDENLVGFDEKHEVIEQELRHCGFFCIISTEEMTAQEAYRLYRGRDSSEKLFAADKTFLGCRSMRVHSEESLETKTFLEFGALIIRNRMYNLLKDEMVRLTKTKNFMTVPAALRELGKIELVRINKGPYQLDHAVTRTQEIILNSFGISKDDIQTRAGEIGSLLVDSDEQNQTAGNTTDNDDENENEEELYDAQA